MKNKNCYKPLFAVCLSLAVLAAILGGISIVTDYDDHANYYVEQAPLYLAACIAAVASLLAGVAAAILTPREILHTSPFTSRKFFPVSACGFLVALIAILTTDDNTEMIPPLLMFLTVGTLILSIVYAVLSGISSLTEDYPTLVAGFGLFAPLSCLFLNVYLYFDLTVEMNAPLKIFVHLGLLGAMLYHTGELRYLLKNPMPRTFLAISAATVAVGSLCTFTLPVAFLTDRFSRLDYLACALLALTVMITAALRTFFLISHEPESNCECAEELADAESESEPLDTQSDSNNEL